MAQRSDPCSAPRRFHPRIRGAPVTIRARSGPGGLRAAAREASGTGAVPEAAGRRRGVRASNSRGNKGRVDLEALLAGHCRQAVTLLPGTRPSGRCAGGGARTGRGRRTRWSGWSATSRAAARRRRGPPRPRRRRSARSAGGRARRSRARARGGCFELRLACGGPGYPRPARVQVSTGVPGVSAAGARFNRTAGSAANARIRLARRPINLWQHDSWP